MSSVPGFYKMSVEERGAVLKGLGLTGEEVSALRDSGALSMPVADRMVENVVGAIHLPMGIATNFVINGNESLIPMALEEPSVIAAACKAAKMCLPEGFTAEADPPIMRGQFQLAGVKDVDKALKTFNEKRKELFEKCRPFAAQMEQYGGGLKRIESRKIRSVRGDYLLVEFFVDVRDAMGANTINTVLEHSTPILREMFGGEERMRIISNLATERKVRSSAKWKLTEEEAERFLDGYQLAVCDIYRCSTHNKGIMNGIDAVAIAAGNDWRAVEAGAHAYASIGGYHPLTHYEKLKTGKEVFIKGTIELPMAVGTVGGAINTSPTARLALKILGAKSASELAMAAASVGLANNFAALYAITSGGIQRGHMKLQARNIAVIAGASGLEEVDAVAEMMAQANNFTASFAKKCLADLRAGDTKRKK